MLHPSYADLMKVVNKDVEEGEEKIVNSRYSIVLATAKRARQLIAGDEALVRKVKVNKPLSVAVDELNNGKLRVITEEEYLENMEAMEAMEAEEAAEMSDVTEE